MTQCQYHEWWRSEDKQPNLRIYLLAACDININVSTTSNLQIFARLIIPGSGAASRQTSQLNSRKRGDEKRGERAEEEEGVKKTGGGGRGRGLTASVAHTTWPARQNTGSKQTAKMSARDEDTLAEEGAEMEELDEAGSDDDEGVEMEEDRADGETEKKVYVPGIEPLQPGEELEMDRTAYRMYHECQTGKWRVLWRHLPFTWPQLFFAKKPCRPTDVSNLEEGGDVMRREMLMLAALHRQGPRAWASTSWGMETERAGSSSRCPYFCVRARRRTQPWATGTQSNIPTFGLMNTSRTLSDSPDCALPTQLQEQVNITWTFWRNYCLQYLYDLVFVL